MNECHSLEVFSVQTTEVSLINLKSKCGHRKETREFNWRFWTVQNNAIIYDQCQCDTHLCNSSVQHLSSKVLVSCLELFCQQIVFWLCFWYSIYQTKKNINKSRIAQVPWLVLLIAYVSLCWLSNLKLVIHSEYLQWFWNGNIR